VAVYCGIDWAEGHHDIALVDDEGRLLAKRRINESVAGLAELGVMLAATGDSADEPIPVAIETPRGLLVAALRATGRPIYPINPLAVARYRERTSVSGKKSDHVDAMALANILRTDRHQHRLLPDDSAEARSISVLARAYQDSVWRRTKLVQELRAPVAGVLPGLPFRVCRRGRVGAGTADHPASQRRRPRGARHRPEPSGRIEGVESPGGDGVAARRETAPNQQPRRAHRRRITDPSVAAGTRCGTSDAGRDPRAARCA